MALIHLENNNSHINLCFKNALSFSSPLDIFFYISYFHVINSHTSIYIAKEQIMILEEAIQVIPSYS